MCLIITVISDILQREHHFRPAMGEDITKEQLKKEIQDILKDADLDNTSAKKVFL